MIYGKGEPTDINDIKALLYVKKAQLDKYRRELAPPSATTNIAQATSNSRVGKIDYHFGTYHVFRGRGRTNRGRGRGRKNYTPDNKPTCQLCNKHDHSVIEYWHKFNESFDPTPTKSRAKYLSTNYLSATPVTQQS